MVFLKWKIKKAENSFCITVYLVIYVQCLCIRLVTFHLFVVISRPICKCSVNIDYWTEDLAQWHRYRRDKDEFVSAMPGTKNKNKKVFLILEMFVITCWSTYYHGKTDHWKVYNCTFTLFIFNAQNNTRPVGSLTHTWTVHHGQCFCLVREDRPMP